MTSNHEIERLVDALLDCTGPIALIVDQMARAPDPLPPEDGMAVLRLMLVDALAPLGDSADRGDLETAAGVVHRAARMIAGELLVGRPRPRRFPRRRRGH